MGYRSDVGILMGVIKSDAKLIVLLENVLSDIMADLDKDISSHAAMILSDESRFISEQIKTIKGKQNA